MRSRTASCLLANMLLSAIVSGPSPTLGFCSHDVTAAQGTSCSDVCRLFHSRSGGASAAKAYPTACTMKQNKVAGTTRIR